MEMHDIVDSLPIENPQSGTRWFCQYGCVVEGDGVNRVFIGDTLLGEFDPRDRDLAPRNILLVMLAGEPKIHLGRLAAAFEISDEHLRRLRQAAKTEGYRGVLTRARGCAERDGINPAKLRELRTLFEEGWNATDATRRQRRRGHVSRSTVSRERRRWQAAQAAERTVDDTGPAATVENQPALFEDVGATLDGTGDAPPGISVHAGGPTVTGQGAGEATAEMIGDDATGVLASAADEAHGDDTKGPIATSTGDVMGEATSDATMAQAVIANDLLGEMAELGTANEVIAERAVAPLTDESRPAASMGADECVAKDDLVAEPSAEDVAKRELPGAHANGVGASDEYERGPFAEDTTAAGVVEVGAITEATNPDRALAEPAITDDVVAERIAAAVTEEVGTATSALTDDGVTTDDLITERAAGSTADLELPAVGTNGALAGDERARGPVTPLRSRPVASGRLVQHVGSWLLMALAQQHGLHQEAARLAGGDATRIALDATLAALAIGECTVEGVRRLQTSTAPLLLRCDHTPTANSVRRRLHAFANEHGAALMARIGERYLDAGRATANEPAVFYVDNHLRTYTGQAVVRKGWRMQDKRSVPGASDYYVHDEDGRPVFRIDTPSHDSLCQWLMPIVTRLRAGLGAEERILLVFDRAGAFPVEMAALRDAGVEFVTYERRPYPDLAPSDFDHTIVVRGETYRVHESRLKNLGDGRGRVRRIALRTTEGKQINLLAISAAPVEQLVGFLMGEPSLDTPSGRWQQENAFKHGAKRWGINQLDGRKVEPYPAGTIIPNPARRRNERALKIARADEGRARCALAAANLTDKRRARAEADLADAVQRRVALELARPMIPKHAPIEQTELAGKLVRHPAELKAVVDTMRIVCANVEAELADIITLALKRPREAKKVIANVFAAPGRVDVTTSEIRVRLSPAANRSEHAAIRRLLAEITARKLTLPGDARSRPLRFELHIS
jgi:hypothetical protein